MTGSNPPESDRVSPAPAEPVRRMRAIVQTKYGSADVLHIGEVDRPSPGRREVLVEVRAASIDRGTWHVMAGLPHVIRLAGFGLRAPKNPVPGLAFAGVVIDVGSDVTRIRRGDEVFGTAKGSLAELAVASEAKLATKPANLTFEQAAAVPVSGLAALHGAYDVGHVEAGQHVLITGASGGVGTFAVQIAKACDAEVTGVCSTGKIDLVRSIGADHVIDYTRDDFADGAHQYDLILDIAGNSSLSRLRHALAPRGTLVIAGGEEGGRWFGGTGRQLRAIVLSPFVSQRLRSFISKENHRDLERLTDLIEHGRLAPVIDSVHPLADARAAMEHLVAGKARGKVVITI